MPLIILICCCFFFGLDCLESTRARISIFSVTSSVLWKTMATN